MNEKILIPRIAKTFIDTSTKGEDTFYVSFPYEFEDIFEQWCNIYNIGYTEKSRKDVVKSDCAVFTNISNASVFI